MVNFSRFRTGSQPISMHDGSLDCQEDCSTKLFQLRDTRSKFRSQSKNLITLKQLEPRHNKEGKELHKLLRQINFEKENHSVSISNNKPCLRNCSNSNNSAHENMKVPVWKQRLGHSKSLRDSNKTGRPIGFKDTNEFAKTKADAESDVELLWPVSSSFPELNGSTKDDISDIHQSSTNATIENALNDAYKEETVVPIGMRYPLYSVIKAQPSEDKEDFSCRSPSVAFSISNPSIGFSLSYPSMNYSDDLSVRSETWESETYSKQRRPHFSSAGQSTSDTISTLGRDDEFFQENSRCSVSSLASDVIRSAAIMLLECNDGCNNEDRDQDYHNVSHRRRHRY